MRLLAVAITTAVSFCSATAATAYPGDRPAHNPTVDTLVGLGQTFWHDRNVQPCPSAQLDTRLDDDLGPGPGGVVVGELTPAGSCTIHLLVDLVARGQSEHGRPNVDRIALCTSVFHALGLTAGLSEIDGNGTSVMDSVPWSDRAVPAACWRWVRQQRVAVS